MKNLACLMVAVGAIWCVVPILAPLTLSLFGESTTVVKVHPMVPLVGALLLMGGLAVGFYATRRSR